MAGAYAGLPLVCSSTCALCNPMAQSRPLPIPASDRTVTARDNGGDPLEDIAGKIARERELRLAGVLYLGQDIGQSGKTTDLALPDADDQRGQFPMADGLLDYFPNALAEVSRVSQIGNEQHNPGQPMHWARDKSTDHCNKVLRHLVDRGRFDGRGVRHTARAAWRILAMLQTELEEAGECPTSRGSK